MAKALNELNEDFKNAYSMPGDDSRFEDSNVNAQAPIAPSRAPMSPQDLFSKLPEPGNPAEHLNVQEFKPKAIPEIFSSTVAPPPMPPEYFMDPRMDAQKTPNIDEPPSSAQWFTPKSPPPLSSLAPGPSQARSALDSLLSPTEIRMPPTLEELMPPAGYQSAPGNAEPWSARPAPQAYPSTQPDPAMQAEMAWQQEQARLAEYQRQQQEYAWQQEQAMQAEYQRQQEQAMQAEYARQQQEYQRQQQEYAWQQEQARQAEYARQVELARQAQYARQIQIMQAEQELARQQELANQAEYARQLEMARQAELANQAELAMQAEYARQMEMARQAEYARQAELAQQTDLARQAELAQQAELARQAEYAMQVEYARQVEMARQAELIRQAEYARQAEMARQSELAMQAEFAQQAELARQADMAMEEELRLQNELAWNPDNAMQTDLAWQPDLALQAELSTNAGLAKQKLGSEDWSSSVQPSPLDPSDPSVWLAKDSDPQSSNWMTQDIFLKSAVVSQEKRVTQVNSNSSTARHRNPWIPPEIPIASDTVSQDELKPEEQWDDDVYDPDVADSWLGEEKTPQQLQDEHQSNSRRAGEGKKSKKGQQQGKNDNKPKGQKRQSVADNNASNSNTGKKKQPKGDSTIKKKIFDVLFYLFLFIVVVVALNHTFTQKGRPIMILGFSVQNVLSGSMEAVYPKGSLILIRSVDPATLKVGDDINFEREENVTWTHRIKEIIKNYEGSGHPAFWTYGITSGTVDKDPVPSVNVLGKVIYCVPKMGIIVNFISKNIVLVLVIFSLLIALSFILPSLIRSYAEEMPKVAASQKKSGQSKDKKQRRA
ncbi:MAG: signal peptidase I [Clostridiales bacterium]|jgi:signal peptidase I|nr:signal peptidase I [Clostridiales bacterium]